MKARSLKVAHCGEAAAEADQSDNTWSQGKSNADMSEREEAIGVFIESVLLDTMS